MRYLRGLPSSHFEAHCVANSRRDTIATMAVNKKRQFGFLMLVMVAVALTGCLPAECGAYW
jgi:hypothetical protein